MFCRKEIKYLHLALPCVLLRRIHETRMTCEKIVFLSNIAKEEQWNNFFNHSNVAVLTVEER